MVTHALSARLPVFLGTKVPERNLQKPSLHVYTKFIFFYDDVPTQMYYELMHFR